MIHVCYFRKKVGPGGGRSIFYIYYTLSIKLESSCRVSSAGRHGFLPCSVSIKLESSCRVSSAGRHGFLPCSVGPAPQQLCSLEWQVSSHGRICNTNGAISFGSAPPVGYFRARIWVEKISKSIGWLGIRSSALIPVKMPGKCTTKMATQATTTSQTLSMSRKHQISANRTLGAEDTARGRPKLSKPVTYRAVGSKDWTRCPSLPLLLQNLMRHCVQRPVRADT